MNKLWIAGLGPGAFEKITLETIAAIEKADKVILRTAMHPAVSGLSARGVAFDACDRFYEGAASFPEVYRDIVDFVFDETRNHETVCYCVPGHPLVAEETVMLILRKAAEEHAKPLDVAVLPALSFLDAAFVLLGTDPMRDGLAILDAASLGGPTHTHTGILPLPELPCLFAQTYNVFVAGELKLALLDELEPEADVIILHHAGIAGEEELLRCPLAELDHYRGFDHLTSVYLPMTGRRKM